MKQDIKQIIRFFLLVTTLWLGVASGVWAQSNFSFSNSDITITGTVTGTGTVGNGGIVADTDGKHTVTLTITPGEGYYIKASDIVVEKLVDPGKANAPERRTPAFADVIPGTMYSGSGRTDKDIISSVKNPNSAEYVFTVPADYDGVYVMATFKSLTEGGIRITSGMTSVTYSSDGHYILVDDIDAKELANFYSATAFTGTFEGEAQADGSFPKISGLTHALFQTVNGGTVKNIVLEGVNISSGTNVGGIANVLTGTSDKIGAIYNCGVLPGSVSGNGLVGSIVGILGDKNNNDNCYARVINCYSYANVSGVGNSSNVGGIVGYNYFASTASDIRTMVMNCMFYGDITSGNKVSPIYGGSNINNLQGGLNTFNYYAYDKLKTAAITEGKYNCALAVEEKYLNRFEFYRLLLNSNKKLAAFYATGSADNGNQMAKWVLETADRSISGRTPHPYPILKAQGYYPSIINPDFENAPDSASVGRNKGGKLPSLRRTLTVTISGSSSNPTGGQSWPTGASLKRTYLELTRTDKDEDRFNFNYDKVQLPYYNDVGTGNYTGNRVVTGWKITEITAINDNDYTSANYPTSGVTDYPNHNYADRKSSNKDLYSVSGRVFSQGAYFDVPYGVTSITIEPYWAKAAYVSDANYDVVYNNSYGGKQNVSQMGTQVGSGATFNGDANQVIKTSVSAALGTIESPGSTVYDNAVVLVGNLHLDGVPSNGDIPFTLMSVDKDNDHEPDYSLVYHHKNRLLISPIRFDFLDVIGTAQAQKPNGASLICNMTICRTKGWFEITNTSLMYFSQFEYENLGKNSSAPYEDNSGKVDAPLILQGGVFDQFVSTQNTAVNGKVYYIHVGGNVWIHEFSMGTHSDGKQSTPHVPVSVTGGDYDSFYLTGTYNPNSNIRDDNAECYISGGRFGELAGAGQEQIGKSESATTKGNIQWQIYNADITEFFGGGINDAKPVQGNITTDIFNSHVTLFCGGPKFGNMASGKKVKTTAEGCVFGKYFGAGYGGNSYSRKKYYDQSGNPTWSTLAGYYTTDKGHYFDGASTNSKQAGTGAADQYGKKGPGIATDFDYEFFVWSSGTTGARLFVKFVSFSLAQCNDVESSLKSCKILENFYGGGSLGKVSGKAKSSLEDCEVTGNVFGAGYSATLPKIAVRSDGFTKAPNFNSSSGMFEPGTYSGTDKFTWTQVENYPSEGGAGFDGTQVITTQNISSSNLGSVGSVDLTIKGNTTVGGSIYGGGEESGVDGDTDVKVTGGTIGAQGQGGVEYGNVYGGGKGKDSDKLAGLVKGNTNVTISQEEGKTTKIYHNVYGGGAYGSVGEFEYADADDHAEHPEVAVGAPIARKTETNGGTTNVTITGGTIGTNGENNGMVFGSSRGDVAKPDVGDGVDPNDRLAWVYDTNVTIGRTQSETPDLANPQIRGSIYGSGENGHTFNDTHVKVYSGTIGIESGSPITDEESGQAYEGPRYPYRGNVYGGGCGTDRYSSGKTDSQGNEFNDMFNFLAGIVLGNTNVEIDGGHIIHNVYGGGAMGSVGTYTTFADETYVAAQAALDKEVPLKKPLACKYGTGLCKVTVTGGEIGTKNMKMDKTDGPDDFGHVFGGGRGDALDPDNYKNIEICAYFGSTELTIKGKAFVRGSVYGGSESGHVLGNTKVVIGGDNEGDNECQIGCGDGVENAYSAEEWASESTNLKPTHHWNYIDDGAPYDQFARENGKYTTGKSAEGGFMVATDGHTFYGNVFAGGSGYYPFAPGEWLFSAGRVEGSATLEIMGGHILNNVYGGCEMSDVLGDVSVTMTGGTVGVPRTKGEILLNPAIGHIFGAGMGDKRIFFNTVTNVQNSNVTVSGGRVYGSVHGGGEDGHVLNKATTTISDNVVIGSVTDGTTSGFDGNVFGGGQGSPTALTAGTVGGNVELNINGGTMYGSVYGGGRIASVGTYFALTTMKNPDNPEEYIPNPLYGKMQDGPDHGYITVNLKGGEIFQNVYGGCMGTRGMAAVDQVRFAVSKNVTVELNKDVLRGCIVKGSIFGCNNVNSSPQENVTVHVYATQNAAATQIANTPAIGTEGQEGYKPAVTNAKEKGRFDVKAVYGGGNMAAYLPKGPDATDNNYDGKNTTYSTHVIIDGCERTSIGQVYGGGNAASTPATEVTVNGTFEIDELFGGGNGADRITYNEGVSYQDNPGANVGFYDYSAEEDTYNTKEKRTTDEQTSETFKEKYVYGTGKAAVNVFGGLINHVFGGSNTKGNVRETAITLLEEKQGTEDCCPFNVGEVYGGGKSAPMDADAKIYMACIPGLKAAYGGAEAADIQGGVTLNITNGTFDRVFGGNNISGTIRGPIEVNIEEIGCRPIIIGELYGGGNLAPYSVYGYNDNGTIKESGTKKAYKDPVVNVKSFTSIGSVYGGGYGSTAVMVGDPTVNINVALGGKASESSAEIGKDGTDWKDMAVKDGQLVEKTVEGSYPIPYHKKDAIGAITNVFGGGNAAEVIGKTSVNIGTRVGEDEYMAVVIKEGEILPTLPEGEKYYTRTGTAPNYTYTETNHIKALEGVTYYKKYVIKGVDIRGNVYGGGNNADVTGDTNVIIGK